ncbi:exported hypothetical protein [Verrucomicrobia bacterium]|nr:exported hypothetical protein [Verrucomicrobiota bacterium]
MKSKESGHCFYGRLSRWIPAAPLLLMGVLASDLADAQTGVVSVLPDADTFVRSMAPTDNFGGAGALSVSGSAAVNGSGQPNGLFDTLIRFPMSNVVAALDSTLGAGNWLVIKSRLIVNEIAMPDNDIFNQGVGAFEIFWLASDAWIEGTGTPKGPTSDGVTWNDLPGTVNPNLDVSLGVFTNSGVDGEISFTLALADPLVAGIRRGADVNLHLTAARPEVGFTFNSRNFGNTNDQPVLEVTAVVNPEPRIGAIIASGGQVSISFQAVSNWIYRLQAAQALTPVGPGDWIDLLVVPAQPTSTNVLYQDAATNQTRFYRLSVSP